MTAVASPDAARLVFAAVAGLILLLVLIIKFKVHAMISILIGAVGIGLMAGMPLSDIIEMCIRDRYFPPHASQTALVVQVAVPPVQLAVPFKPQRKQMMRCV